MQRLLQNFVWTLLLIGLTASCDRKRDETNNIIKKVDISDKVSESYFLISRTGDTIPTGVPVPAKGKWIDPESVAKPKSIPLKGKPKIVPAHTNVNLAGAPKVVPISENLTMITPGENGVPLPETVPAQGKVVAIIQPRSVPALSLRFTNDAINNIQYLDVDEGMNSSRVNSMLEDSQGYIWFGTHNGVSRYDGSSFTHFTTEAGLIHNIISSILEDGQGNLWFGTPNGVCCYNGTSFTHYNTEEGLSDNRVNAMFEDSQGNLWFGTYGGVSRYDGTSFTHFTTEQGLSQNRVSSILEDSQGNLWFGTYGNGVNRYDGSSFINFTTEQGLSDNFIWSMFEDRQGHLWFGTLRRGVNRYDGASFTHYTTKEGLSGNSVGLILEDSQDNLWFGTSGGVCCYDGASFTYYTTEEGLSDNRIMSILEDSQGNLWFGTLDNGVNRYDGSSFINFTTEQGLSHNFVIPILEDSQGYIWLGNVGGVNRYDGSSFTHFTTEQGLSHNDIGSILEDSQGNLWFGTLSGVNRYDGSSFTHFTTKEGLSHDIVRSILEDSQGNLWFGTYGGGVNRYDGSSFTHFTTEQGLSHNIVRSILEDSQGNLWFGTYGGGVSRYDGASFTHFTTEEGLINNYISSILEDSQGNLWFGTHSGGMSRYDGASFIHFTTEEGLINNNIGSILEDNKKNIWISTRMGIGLLAPLPEEDSSGIDSESIDYRIFAFGKKDGLKRIEFTQGSGACLDRKNRIWWGSLFGLYMLDLNQFELSTESPLIMLDHIEVKEEFVDFRSLADTSYANTLSFGNTLSRSFDSVAAFYNYPIEITLPFNINHLTFHFSGIDWAAPHKIKYSYFLEGLEDNWNSPKSENKADYRNIPYGTFTFKVKAIGEAQVYSEPFEYTFTIRPPWWHTLWARVLYVIIGLTTIFGYIRWRTHTLRMRQKELEQTVIERTAEVVAEKEVSEKLLLNILPSETAEELKQYGAAKAKNYDTVTVLFTDFKGFTQHSERLNPEELVAELDYCFKAFDLIMEKFNVEKIKTIGDAYMAAAGLPTANTSNPVDAVKAALAVRDFMLQYKSELEAKEEDAFEIRIGIHSGPVVAGIVGIKKFAYDIWGDTVNLAARMESSGEVGRVNVSQSTYEHLKDHPEFTFIPRGKVKAKNKGEIDMYFVENG